MQRKAQHSRRQPNFTRAAFGCRSSSAGQLQQLLDVVGIQDLPTSSPDLPNLALKIAQIWHLRFPKSGSADSPNLATRFPESRSPDFPNLAPPLAQIQLSRFPKSSPPNCMSLNRGDIGLPGKVCCPPDASSFSQCQPVAIVFTAET